MNKLPAGSHVLDTQVLVMVEDCDYNLGLYCKKLPQCEELEVRQLFHVTLADKTEHFVLAESPQGAIGQATCGQGRSWSDQKDLEAAATAVRVPFKIRGWSDRQF